MLRVVGSVLKVEIKVWRRRTAIIHVDRPCKLVPFVLVCSNDQQVLLGETQHPRAIFTRAVVSSARPTAEELKYRTVLSNEAKVSCLEWRICRYFA